MSMRKLRILLLVAVLAAIALIGARTAFAAASSGAEESARIAPAQQQTPERGDKDCPFKDRSGSETAPALDA